MAFLSENSDDSELFWEQLLAYIVEERVVPVVGQDLLKIQLDSGVAEPLYLYLAQRLASKLRVSAKNLPERSALNEVACRYLSRGGRLSQVYSSLKTVMPNELPIPEPLLKLAEIWPLSLFFTTTFDPLMERALNQVRAGGRPITRVASYYPKVEMLDEPADPVTSQHPLVVHLLGGLSTLPEYAVTEEDTLEFVHALQTERHLHRVLDALDQRPLLLLGNSFPDWLARFFLRVGSGARRLSEPRGKTDALAESRLRDDPELVLFLRRFGPEIMVFEEGPLAFIDELHRRWTATHTGPTVDVLTTQLVEVPDGAIFISYDSRDGEAAGALQRDLSALGMDIWFDKTSLRGGENFSVKIQRAIQNCSVFVPLISQRALEKVGFVWEEWTQAESRARRFPRNREFLVPVVLDRTSPQHRALPEAFAKLHWRRWPEDRSALLADLQRLYRSYRVMKQGEF